MDGGRAGGAVRLREQAAGRGRERAEPQFGAVRFLQRPDAVLAVARADAVDDAARERRRAPAEAQVLRGPEQLGAAFGPRLEQPGLGTTCRRGSGRGTSGQSAAVATVSDRTAPGAECERDNVMSQFLRVERISGMCFGRRKEWYSEPLTDR